MTSYSVIRFKDETLGRITTTESVKLSKSNKKFTPKSAKDLPEVDVKVKWQKSAASGSFSSDGYFDAEVLALAGKLNLVAFCTASKKPRFVHQVPQLYR